MRRRNALRLVLQILLFWLAAALAIVAHVALHEAMHFAAAGEMPRAVEVTDDPEAALAEHTRTQRWATPAAHGSREVLEHPVLIVYPTNLAVSAVSLGQVHAEGPRGNTALAAAALTHGGGSPLVAAAPFLAVLVLMPATAGLAILRPNAGTLGLHLATWLQPRFSHHHISAVFGPEAADFSVIATEFVAWESLILLALFPPYLAWLRRIAARRAGRCAPFPPRPAPRPATRPAAHLPTRPARRGRPRQALPTHPGRRPPGPHDVASQVRRAGRAPHGPLRGRPGRSPGGSGAVAFHPQPPLTRSPGRVGALRVPPPRPGDA